MDDEDKQVNSLIRHVCLLLTMNPHRAVPLSCCQASSELHHLGYNYRLGSEPVKFPCSKKRLMHRNYHEPPMGHLELTLMQNCVSSKATDLTHLLDVSNHHFQVGFSKCNFQEFLISPFFQKNLEKRFLWLSMFGECCFMAYSWGKG